ncbi:hypothetical protein HPB52_007955 [Rhipicephalus sanguineus]|uniref:Uncharacterized protein n=1 Tax=Rhipicephalus sanguineus TaxID=34632 RepID=A0A9D4QJB9_RHISA|nr:hypothetical protein HPB52_007955 [Rhipicephalus sanguineus]
MVGRAMCGECTRWCYLDETAFTSLADADEVSFVCKLCEKVKAAKERAQRTLPLVRHLPSPVESHKHITRRRLRGRLQCWQHFCGRVQAETAERLTIGTWIRPWLGEARERGEATASLVEQMEADLRKERERRAELEERVKALMALDSGPEQCEAKGKGNTESQAETGKKGDLGAAVAHVETGDSRRKSYSDVARQSSGGTKQGAPAAGSLSRVGDTQRTGNQRARTGSQQSQAGSERLDRRRVLVVGDCNVARVEQSVLTTVKADRRVKVEAQSGKCMTNALANTGKEREPSETEDGVRKLREASEGVHVTICTIPEVWGQSGGMERRVIEANCVIRGVSRQLGYSVMEVNKDVYEPGFRPFAQDGIHYSGATGRRVGYRMGRQATAFLGGPSALRPPV